MESGPGERYYEEEWKLFERNPNRYQASLKAASGLEVRRVLDIGCGAGQELLPFVQHLQAHGVGVDISPDAVRVARRHFDRLGLSDRVQFECAPAEQLPFESVTFDLAVCRVVLPYTNNDRLIAEVRRVLRPGGIFLLKIHHLRFYLRQLIHGVRACDRSAIHALRVLTAGTLYHTTGIQPKNRLTGSEVYQTERNLRKVLARHGMSLLGEMDGSDSEPAAPWFRITVNAK